jgi:hypothetical protein
MKCWNSCFHEADPANRPLFPRAEITTRRELAIHAVCEEHAAKQQDTPEDHG